MAEDLETLIALASTSGGVISYGQALSAVPRHSLERAIRRGDLVRLLPSTYVLAAGVDDPPVRARAALVYAGPLSALSHVSALRALRLPAPCDAGEHVTVWSGRQPRNNSVATFHRACTEIPTVVRDGIRVVRLEHAIVTSWPLGTEPDRRAPALAAVGDRRTTPARLRAVALVVANLADRAGLLALLDQLADGCRSPLELWGYAQVFAHPSLPRSVGQFRVELGRRSIYLDRAFEAERVDVELDGAAFHRAPLDRERDLRRDADLVRRGWVVLRYTHSRLHREPAESIRAELRGVLAERRRQLRIAG